MNILSSVIIPFIKRIGKNRIAIYSTKNITNAELFTVGRVFKNNIIGLAILCA